MILDFCDENGIEAYLSDEWCIDDLSVTDAYKHHPSYTGSYLIDEPGTDDMPALTKIQNKYLEETGRTPFANLLPMYANAAQTVTAWYNGYPQPLKCENGAYNITLDSGEGVFITIE
ncbi:MAG: hypothetical protein IJY39_12930 [Clostridia bacterium]|nr:hypothetical protein [Clostridia bacterium]